MDSAIKEASKGIKPSLKCKVASLARLLGHMLEERTESLQTSGQTSSMMKNYKSFIVHGSFVDIMAIQIHFRYISMIIHFSHNEHCKVICLVVCIV